MRGRPARVVSRAACDAGRRGWIGAAWRTAVAGVAVAAGPSVALVAAGWARPARAQAPGQGQAPTADGPWLVVPFAQKVDIGTVRRVVAVPPARLLPTLSSLGVDVLVVKSPPGERPLNPLLAPLPVAPEEVVRRAEFRESYEGRMILRGDRSCDLPRDTILIRDVASTYTLLHEFAHSRLAPTDDCPAVDDTELQFAVDLRRLVTYQRRLYDDAFRLLDPQWREDILAAQAAVTARLFRRIQIGHSQEAVVEKVLATHIDERSPYHDPGRRAQGLRYAELMIDNAIDLYNLVDAAIAYVRETVRHLHDEIRAGRLAPPADLRLTAEDAAAAEQAAGAMQPAMARVRNEIQALKQFFTA